MTKMSISYEGQLRCKAIYSQSGEIIRTDAPLDNNGRGESFSPTDLVATALASCMITVMGISAEKNGIEIGKIEADVEKTMASEPRRVQKVQIELRMRAKLNESERKRMESVARNCPVAKSLNPELIQDITFTYV
ncbi:MAG: OsmC family protein [Flavobacteriales bacterium]|nr:OsmC family protein [Flavobacteriales bacterium]